VKVATVEKNKKPSAALENWVNGQNMYRNGKRGSGRLAFAVTPNDFTTHVRSFMILYVAAHL
jgi:hypothetical protein